MDAKVLVTGLGVISPIGTGKDLFWQNLLSGKSGVDEIKGFDTAEFRVHRGCEVKDFVSSDYIAPLESQRIGKASQFAVACTKMAIEDAHIKLDALDSDRMGVCFGTTMGEAQVFETLTYDYIKKGKDSISECLLVQYPPESITANIARIFNIKGPNTILPAACAAGNYAIGYGFDMIKNGLADIMICGGVDVMSVLAFTGFARILSIAPDFCRPFDKERKGLILGEGCGVVILERDSNLKKRNAKPYAQLLGYSLSIDAHHITMPHPEGKGLAKALKDCLERCQISPREIDYISAHGTGTVANDKAETLAVKDVLKEDAYKVGISSIKSMIGHTLGAASAIEAVTTTLAIRDNIVPPTINYKTKDPDCDLDYVPNEARKERIDLAISNSSAFGGNNAVIALGRYKD